MTMPHLSNCPHSPDSHCLACVKAEREKLDAILADRSDLIAACRDVLPDLEHYASTHGPGPDRRLAHLRSTIEKCEALAMAMHSA